MGYYRAAVAILLLLAPLAVASDPLREPICDPSIGCRQVIDSCPVEFQDGRAVCIPHPCDTGFEELRCGLDIAGPLAGCAINVTITGSTCAVTVFANSDAHREVVLPGVGDLTGNSLGASVELTNGSVDDFNLVNSWISPKADAHAQVLGITLADTRIGLYRSIIQVDGEGKTAIDNILPGEGHTFSQILLTIEHESEVTGPLRVGAQVLLLDLTLEGCTVTTSNPDVPLLRCPRSDEILP